MHVIRLASSLIPLGCLPFCMQIVFDYAVLHNLLFFVLLNCMEFNRWVRCGVLWHYEMAARNLKSHPVLHRLLLSPVCVGVFVRLLISLPTNPDLTQADWGSAHSLGHVGWQGARKCPPSSLRLEELSVKKQPPNQSLMGVMRHGFRWENKRGRKCNSRYLWLGFGACSTIASWLIGWKKYFQPKQ